MWRRIGAVVVLGLTVACQAQKGKKEAALYEPNARVGVSSRVFHPKAARNWRGAEAKELSVVVWYPAVNTAVETKQFVGPPQAPLFVAGSAMPHAAMEPTLRKLPMVVLSHGMGGSAEQMAWLGTELARSGYVAVAVNHPGNNSHGALTPEGFALWWERATDVSNVIDGMLADEDFGPQIDTARIGAAGFSIGGYTVLELAGARTDISVYFDHCRREPQKADCHVPEMKGMGNMGDLLLGVRKTSGESLARSSDSFRDPRVKAVFAMAPGAGETLTADSLHSIKVPVEIVVGDRDVLAPAKENADYIRASSHARENVLPGGVGHYTFLDACTADGRKELPEFCTDAPGVEREKVHAEAVDEAVRFFDRALKVR